MNNLMSLNALMVQKNNTMVTKKMQAWKPISLNELYSKIRKSETDFSDELFEFWQEIKITPTKWRENKYGEKGGGLWVVAICGTQVVWYNDIEDGFNISNYRVYGEIEEYYCNQDELSPAVAQLFELLRLKGHIP